MSDLVEFLRLRLDEDEQAAREYLEVIEEQQRWSAANPGAQSVAFFNFTLPGGAGHPTRVLADVEADRKLIAAYFDLAEKRRVNAEKFTRLMRAPADNDDELPSTKTHGWELSGRMDGLLMALQIRVNRFADHPEFDEEWRI